ncbi:MAG: hypothetical protein M3389_04175 [Actinomycetota bacterium]|nr:hypothetical protein [Actinomycetota bacterium]
MLNALGRTGVLLALVVLGLAGCGDNGRGEYIAQADRVCRDGMASASVPAAAAKDPHRQARRAVGEFRDALRRLSALEPPPELRRDVRAYLENARRHLELFERATDVPDDAAQRLAASSSTKRLNTRAAALAERIGFKVCS